MARKQCSVELTNSIPEVRRPARRPTRAKAGALFFYPSKPSEAAERHSTCQSKEAQAAAA
eukprot:5093595-Pyramimonas_sp.AAC.1